jgi:RimJ/RimL family protein N-acetyltransferase
MSFRSQGDLTEWLYQGRHWEEYHDTDVILVKEDDILLGWGLRRENGDVGFWTKRSARGQGIGLKMVKTAAKLGDIRVHPHDDASRALFRKAGLTMKAVNYTLYDKDLDKLKTLEEEYRMIGRDTKLEIAKIESDPHKLTVFPYAPKEKKNASNKRDDSKPASRS